MKSAEIREAFLRFFEEKGHTRVASSSLIPANDPTLLFTNAGMNQFKDCFLGLEKRAYTRATTSQKCVRAGGKHNDLENVGYTARHHTFFEMLGNFSFGDYFKRDAIHYAWEFLTSDKWLNLPKEKLWVTVYATDDEAYDIWTKEVGVPAERMVRIGDNKGAPYASDNFWAMGDTGPCGPCTEIFFDHGEHIWGGPPGSPEEDGDRYIEIWNNVFMQFNRTADGVLHPLPAPSVDTGMGLERISAVLQHVNSNYEIDLFQSLLNAAADAIGCANEGQASLKVVADHIRSCGFLIADGVTPSNEGRGYVLRRIIRRACRHGNKLGAKGSFFHRIVAALVAEMGDAFPELKQQQAHIERVLKNEEEQFAKTLEQGLKILEQDLAALAGSVIPGEVVFKLYDTYGFPVDLTGDIARERNLTLDEEGMTATFYRDQAQIREDAQYLTLEHPFTESVMEMINTQGFGSTNVAVLKSAALPQGSVLLEVWFKVDVVAPKALNLPSSLPQQLVRVLLSEKGQDLSQKIAPEILKPYLHHLDGNSCRQVVKARREVIEARYQQALELARAALPQFKQQAKEVYGSKWQYEIDRLTYLKQFNPSIREDEISRLQKLQKEGLSLLDGLSVTPEAIQVMVVVKP